MFNRNEKIPTQRVIPSNKEIKSIIWRDFTDFVNPFSIEEQKIIIKASSTRILTNDPVVRLESLEDGVATIAKIKFFDFMSTNYFYNRQDNVENAKPLKQKLLATLKGCNKGDFDSILSQSSLANSIGISLLLEDPRGNYLLCTRSNSVAVSSADHTCSVTASMNESDLASSNPFITCASRELYEELALYADITMQQIIISKQKLQPIVLLHGRVPKPFTELKVEMTKGRDYYKENSFMHVVPKSKALRAIRYNDFTDAAAYHVFYSVTDGNTTSDNWRSGSAKPLGIADFLLQM